MTTTALPAVGRPPSGQGRVILRMSVQLPDGQRGTIHVFPGSDPHALAEEFCTKHNLTDPKLLMVRARRPPPATPPHPTHPQPTTPRRLAHASIVLARRQVVERHIATNLASLPTKKPYQQAASQRALPAPAHSANGRAAAPVAATKAGGAPVPSAVPAAPARATAPAVREAGDAGGRTALSSARLTAVQWRMSGAATSLLLRCWRALEANVWEARVEKRRATTDRPALPSPSPPPPPPTQPPPGSAPHPPARPPPPLATCHHRARRDPPPPSPLQMLPRARVS